jgi:hypothetical protein
MPTYSVIDVLEIIRALTPEQKLELQGQLPSILSLPSKEAITPGQSQSMSGVKITGSSDIDLSQIQADHGSNITQNNTEATIQNADFQEALSLLEKLKQEIASNNTINPLLKEVVEEKIQAIQKEVQKPQPDKSLVDQAIAALKKGLTGVEELAEPVMKVASLVAKAWMVIP